ncbi:hypothetical protein GY45DRAFT_329820 [Cubamyces sp. BRFM 1775]|nr:hypothetical protein GY45DRAFT_329820 [Cubamyces sp. BRFM 1775]
MSTAACSSMRLLDLPWYRSLTASGRMVNLRKPEMSLLDASISSSLGSRSAGSGGGGVAKEGGGTGVGLGGESEGRRDVGARGGLCLDLGSGSDCGELLCGCNWDGKSMSSFRPHARE